MPLSRTLFSLSISTFGTTTAAPPSTVHSWEEPISCSGTEIIRFYNTWLKFAVRRRDCARSMQRGVTWHRIPLFWVEVFALLNLGGLAPDIFLAHSTNYFRHSAEYAPLYFSIAAPILLAPAVWLLNRGELRWWRWIGNAVGWASVLVGVVGLILHLESQFFQQRTLASLVYAAPFAAPLAYTGIGFLLIMNRMVDRDSIEWPLWV